MYECNIENTHTHTHTYICVHVCISVFMCHVSHMAVPADTHTHTHTCMDKHTVVRLYETTLLKTRWSFITGWVDVMGNRSVDEKLFIKARGLFMVGVIRSQDYCICTHTHTRTHAQTNKMQLNFM